MEVGAFGTVSQAKPSLERRSPLPGVGGSPTPLDLETQAHGGVGPSALMQTSAFPISQEEGFFPCDAKKKFAVGFFFFQCPNANPFQSSNGKPVWYPYTHTHTHKQRKNNK